MRTVKLLTLASFPFLFHFKVTLKGVFLPPFPSAYRQAINVNGMDKLTLQFLQK
jgi:hypothetical protein